MIRQDANDGRGPPVDDPPSFIRIRHPGNNHTFLELPSFDPVELEQGQHGVHYGTALEACKILAYNKPGYFTTSIGRTSGPVSGPVDLVMLPGVYYYHLATEGQPLYPICCDFRKWTFPHNALPPEWVPNNTPMESIDPCNWTAVSQRVKDRDERYRVTGWRDSLSTAHVVPRNEDTWVCGLTGRHFIANISPATRK
jgi:hypothetical protein